MAAGIILEEFHGFISLLELVQQVLFLMQEKYLSFPGTGVPKSNEVIAGIIKRKHGRNVSHVNTSSLYAGNCTESQKWKKMKFYYCILSQWFMNTSELSTKWNDYLGTHTCESLSWIFHKSSQVFTISYIFPSSLLNSIFLSSPS